MQAVPSAGPCCGARSHLTFHVVASIAGKQDHLLVATAHYCGVWKGPRAILHGVTFSSPILAEVVLAKVVGSLQVASQLLPPCSRLAAVASQTQSFCIRLVTPSAGVGHATGAAAAIGSCSFATSPIVRRLATRRGPGQPPWACCCCGDGACSALFALRSCDEISIDGRLGSLTDRGKECVAEGCEASSCRCSKPREPTARGRDRQRGCPRLHLFVDACELEQVSPRLARHFDQLAAAGCCRVIISTEKQAGVCRNSQQARS